MRLGRAGGEGRGEDSFSEGISEQENKQEVLKKCLPVEIGTNLPNVFFNA